jgi:chromosome segregation ATPase
VQRAQEKVKANTGLTEAAQLEQENAQARLRVLQLAKTSAESQDAEHTELKKELAAVQLDIDQADAISTAKTAVTGAKTSIQAKAGEITGSIQQELNDLTGPEAPLSNSEHQLSELMLSSAKKGALTRRLNSLQSKLNEVEQKQQCQPKVKPEEVKQAEGECSAANLAVLQAPELIRDAEIKFQALQEELAEAENRESVAKANRDEVEQLFLKDIAFTGPDPEGFVTATVELWQDLPPDYSLQWTLNGIPFQADKQEKKIRFPTQVQPGVGYDINVNLQKDSTTK